MAWRANITVHRWSQNHPQNSSQKLTPGTVPNIAPGTSHFVAWWEHVFQIVSVPTGPRFISSRCCGLFKHLIGCWWWSPTDLSSITDPPASASPSLISWTSNSTSLSSTSIYPERSGCEASQISLIYLTLNTALDIDAAQTDNAAPEHLISSFQAHCSGGGGGAAAATEQHGIPDVNIKRFARSSVLNRLTRPCYSYSL